MSGRRIAIARSLLALGVALLFAIPGGGAIATPGSHLTAPVAPLQHTATAPGASSPASPPTAAALGTNLSVAYTLRTEDGALVAGARLIYPETELFGPSTYDPANGRLYAVGDIGQGVIVDASTGEVAGSFTGNSYEDALLYLPQTGLVYLEQAGTLYAIDPSNGTTLNSLDLRVGPYQRLPQAFAWDPESGLLIVAGANATELETVNVTSLRDVGQASVGFAAEALAYDPGRHAILAVDSASKNLAELNASTGAVITTASLATTICTSSIVNPADIGVDPTTDDVYVTESAYGLGSCLLKLSGSTPAVQTATALGGSVGGIAYVPPVDRLIVADGGNDAVYSVFPSNLTVGATVLVPNATLTGFGGINHWSVDYVAELGAVYVPLALGNAIVGIDPATLQLFQRIVTSASLQAISWDATAGLYAVTDYDNNRVDFVDPGNFSLVGATPLAGPGGDIAYDPVGDQLAVVIAGTSSPVAGVEFLNASTWVETGLVRLSGLPERLAVDPTSGAVFVTEYLGPRVDVIDPVAHTVVGTLPVGHNPVGVAIDPRAGTLYIADAGGDNVTVDNVSTGKSVASIVTGAPEELSWSAYDGRVYVANTFNDNITPIDTATFTAVGSLACHFPGRLVADPNGPFLYAASDANLTAFNVSSGSGSNLPLPGFASAAAVGASGDLIATAGALLVELAATPPARVANATLAVRPFSIAVGSSFDLWLNASGGTGPLSYSYVGAPTSCAASTSSQWTCAPTTVGRFGIVGTVRDATGDAVVRRAFLWVYDVHNLTFTESGLPSAAPWSVTVAGARLSTANVSAVFRLADGTYGFSVNGPALYGASPSAGDATLRGQDLTVPITFARLYTLTFRESGLPGGTSWGITIGGVLLRSTATSLSLNETNGSYAFTTEAVSGYAATPTSGVATVAGANLTVDIAFAQLYTVTFRESGLPAGTIWSVVVNGSTETGTGATISLDLPNGSYAWSAPADGAYLPAPSGGSVDVNGTGLEVNITFTLTTTGPSEYLVSFVETGLAIGTAWTVVLGGTPITGTGSTLSANESNGTYSYVIETPSGYRPSATGGDVTVDGADASVAVTFLPLVVRNGSVTWYDVTFQEVGLASGTAWGVVVNGTAHTTTASFEDVYLANGSFVYTPSAVDGFTTPASSVLHVDGAPTSVTVTYEPVPATPGSPAPGEPLLTPLETGAVITAAVVAAALASVILWRRRRARMNEVDSEEEPPLEP